MNEYTLVFLAASWLILIISMSINFYNQKKSNHTLFLSHYLHQYQSWLWLLIILTIGIISPHYIAAIFFALTSFLALREYLNELKDWNPDRSVLVWLSSILILQFFWATLQWYTMFSLFIPFYLFILIPFLFSLSKTTPIIPGALTLQWGLIITVYTLSHFAYIVNLPPRFMGLMTGSSILFYLVLLTLVSQFIQYYANIRYGRWVALLLSIAIAVVLSAIIAPYLTVFSWQIAIFFGALISLSSFIGTTTIPIIKNELGIQKKQNNALSGDMLECLNALTITAPVFLHFILSIYYR